MKCMRHVQQSQAIMRKRKMMMVLPLLVIPFITMAFWALGGGKGSGYSKSAGNHQGLNLNLPDANLKEDKLSDKLSFYDKAERDSLKLGEWMRSDPYYRHRENGERMTNEIERMTETTASKFNQRLNTSPYESSASNPEQKIMQKLALLEKELNKPSERKDNLTEKNEEIDDTGFSGEVNRLESMMEAMNSGNGDDPEIKQLENTLDKILDIQHPERIKGRIKEKSIKNKEVVFTVSQEANQQSISLLDTGKRGQITESGFYGLNDEGDVNERQYAVEAVIHENQTLVNNSVIKLRLLTDIYINGSLIPKDNFVFGIASLNDERLEVEINSIRYNHSLLTVKLEVYDMDGLPGIYVPGAITREVAKQSADNSLQLMELSTMDPSLKAQAAAAGINTAKNLLSKKVKQIKVMVKAGYKVLLKNKNVQQ